jgi:hypothetical protein
LSSDLSAFASDTTSQLDVLWHDGDSLGMDGAQVGVYELSNQISFAGFLQGYNSGVLESQIGLEVLSDLTDQTLERQFADQQFSRFLIATDFSESHCTGTITMWFLDSSSGWCIRTIVCAVLFHRSIYEQSALYEPEMRLTPPRLAKRRTAL